MNSNLRSHNFWVMVTAAVTIAGCSLTPPTMAPTPAVTLSPTPSTAVESAVPTIVPPEKFDPATVEAINIDDYPILPTVNEAMRTLYQQGLAAGNNPHVLSKLGDCMTENPYFLAPFADGKYDLGAYQELQDVIRQFSGYASRGNGWEQDSLATVGLASASGFNVASVLDPTWADPQWCSGSESPIACEYRVTRSSLAVIMFGTNDVTYTDPGAYNFYLRQIVKTTLDHQIVPLVSTFPTRPEDPDKSKVFNQIAIQVALDYGVPLVNLNRALESLPNLGVNPNDTIHLSVPPDDAVDVFDAEHLRYGFTVRNLVTLQALDAVWRAVR